MRHNKAGCQNAAQVGRKPCGPVEEEPDGRNEASRKVPRKCNEELLNWVQILRCCLPLLPPEPPRLLTDSVLYHFYFDSLVPDVPQCGVSRLLHPSHADRQKVEVEKVACLLPPPRMLCAHTRPLVGWLFVRLVVHVKVAFILKLNAQNGKGNIYFGADLKVIPAAWRTVSLGVTNVHRRTSTKWKKK